MKTAQQSRWGGERLGSGRKPKMKYEARELFYAAIDERWAKILKKIDHYITKGDKDILKMIIEQRIGRPSQQADITLEQKLPTPFISDVQMYRIAKEIIGRHETVAEISQGENALE